MNKIIKLLVFTIMSTLAAVPAFAVDVLTMPTMDISPVYGLATTMLGALAVIWVVRKIIGLAGR